MLTLLLQLLPVRQAIKYFFIDNILVEEIVEVNKGATKNFRLPDDDHGYTYETSHSTHFLCILENTFTHLYDESIPAFHVADILTPPPDLIH